MRTTKLELQQLLTAANKTIEDLREQLSIVTAERDMFARTAHNAIARRDEERGLDPATAAPPERQTKPVARGAKRIFEFDPSIKGDFARASALARAENGVVRRAMQ